jgi:Rrf2 family transcriptional regulator, cysteine metabolism repressor
MNISVKGQYALHAVFDLSLAKPNTPVKIADIAKRQKIPQKFLELILSGLKQGGFVESRRGAEGGYLLARPAESLHVGEVVRYVEGGKQPKGRSRRKGDSPLSDLWHRVDEAVSEVLDRTTFADLARDWHENQRKYVPDWEI